MLLYKNIRPKSRIDKRIFQCNSLFMCFQTTDIFSTKQQLDKHRANRTNIFLAPLSWPIFGRTGFLVRKLLKPFGFNVTSFCRADPFKVRVFYVKEWSWAKIFELEGQQHKLWDLLQHLFQKQNQKKPA